MRSFTLRSDNFAALKYMLNYTLNVPFTIVCCCMHRNPDIRIEFENQNDTGEEIGPWIQSFPWYIFLGAKMSMKVYLGSRAWISSIAIALIILTFNVSFQIS